MIEGWLNDEYLSLLSREESASYSERCELATLLPGFSLVGFRSWDDFIVRDSSGETYSLPTVPVLAANLVPFSLPPDLRLEVDARFSGTIKWYVKPLCFGGEVTDQNQTWLPLQPHAESVAWWNNLYKSMAGAC